ncbi:Mitochondrial distribution and morphology protein 12 [Smittium culicis]|uniref:Mitochondrial distribution and morphology protein 12 n=1 Tax=Smittium culicis TaxID=133412 RepID=A0A1R1YEL5_9FUNG|nr:Mitochondrial distribution and morphology protein 12 [Smittium culicis]
MSFDIHWSKMDSRIASTIQNKLNEYFSNLSQKPSVIGDIKVTQLNLGNQPPQVELLDITPPFTEFYLPTAEEIIDQQTQDLYNQIELEKILLDNDSFDNTRLQESIKGFDFKDINKTKTHSNKGFDEKSTFSINSDFERRFNTNSVNRQRLNIPEYTQKNEYSLSNDLNSNFMHNNVQPSGIYSYGTPNVGLHSFQDSKSAIFSLKSDIFPSRKNSVANSIPYNQNSAHTFPHLRNTSNAHASSKTNRSVTSSTNNSRFNNKNFSSIENSLYQHTPNSSPYNSQSRLHNSIVPGQDDLQLHFKLAYSGDCSITLTAELQLNYPASSFISLPITFIVSNLKFSATAVVAYLTDRLSFSFLEPELPRTSLLDDLSIKSEIGDDHQQVLKNVESVEKFIVEQIRKAIDENFVLPSYTCIEF